MVLPNMSQQNLDEVFDPDLYSDTHRDGLPIMEFWKNEMIARYSLTTLGEFEYVVNPVTKVGVLLCGMGYISEEMSRNSLSVPVKQARSEFDFDIIAVFISYVRRFRGFSKSFLVMLYWLM